MAEKQSTGTQVQLKDQFVTAIVVTHDGVTWLSGSQRSELWSMSFGMQAPAITVSWKLAGVHLVQRLKQHFAVSNGRMDGAGGGYFFFFEITISESN